MDDITKIILVSFFRTRCICNTTTFESIDVQSLFLVCRDISSGYQSSLYV